MSTQTTPVDEVVADPAAPWGYRRSEALQARFHRAAERLCDADADGGQGQLRADLVLEGGGVKGIGLLGAILALAEAGYRFQRVAGTSAGAIVGAFVAAAEHAGRPLWCLRPHLDALHIDHLAPMGRIQAKMEHVGGVARVLADAEILSHRPGLHSSEGIVEWLRCALVDDFGVRTFADLRIDDDPKTSLPPSRRFRLVVHVADVTRGQLVRLPWDYHYYGLDRDGQDVAEAVRASMSIPLYFEPVVVQATRARVKVPRLDGSSSLEEYEGGTVTWVDGGLLQNFPMRAFDRSDGVSSRWPTIGIRLSHQGLVFPETAACHSAIDVAIRCMHTAINEWDRYGLDQVSAARTVYVDSAGLTATQFDLSESQRSQLFMNGVRAGTAFVLDAAESGGLVGRGAAGPGRAPATAS